MILKSRKNRRFLIAAVIWMVVIFCFSARPGPDSSKDSSRVGRLILTIVKPGFRSLPPEEQYAMAAAISHPVRKAAHATEYAILGILYFGTLYRERRETCSGRAGSLRIALLSWVLAVCYAASDEIHQYFVPDRACALSDVFIDGTGALGGVLLFVLIVQARRRIGQKKG